ncbi:MAG: PH domain-containing protein [Planctomycetota bacterium]
MDDHDDHGDHGDHDGHGDDNDNHDEIERPDTPSAPESAAAGQQSAAAGQQSAAAAQPLPAHTPSTVTPEPSSPPRTAPSDEGTADTAVAAAAVSETQAPEPPLPLPPLGQHVQLDPRVKSMWRFVNGSIRWIFGSGLAAFGCVAVYHNAPPDWLLPTVIAASAFSLFLIVVAIAWPALAYKHRSYRLDAEGLEIRRGVFWRSVLYVPRSRVQHTDVNQGPIERMFGLSHLVVHTAGTSNASVTLDGLATAIAEGLRDYLVASKADDAV